jgi:hypothetical protein
MRKRLARKGLKPKARQLLGGHTGTHFLQEPALDGRASHRPVVGKEPDGSAVEEVDRGHRGLACGQS